LVSVDPRAVFVLVIVAAMSLGSISACFYDKSQARRGGRRIRERTLLLLALLGGSPGLVLGMVLARHKTKKASFLGRLFVVLMLQVALAWFLLDQAA
jgi:uncharacterized membrane protein YsdA (DUF1294 family)